MHGTLSSCPRFDGGGKEPHAFLGQRGSPGDVPSPLPAPSLGETPPQEGTERGGGSAASVGLLRRRYSRPAAPERGRGPSVQGTAVAAPPWPLLPLRAR